MTSGQPVFCLNFCSTLVPAVVPVLVRGQVPAPEVVAREVEAQVQVVLAGVNHATVIRGPLLT